MRIKQLPERTGVPSPMLRYYEESQVAIGKQICSLLNAGLTTEIVRAVLPF
ncbi:hypothetical protein GCM10011583_71230 [Streptomyces camponoticapitis]|uniref:Uncharacterized protein n=1 Tax=Streptomyces camponoticapitis TaxID=1616125 RepID=A0ABQ2EXA9_9ACTN|nr:hypothetical protein GCM10011583_71230 [Streptomyces camponoticapitis]